MSSEGNNNQWAWLGLLKWSLSYSDGTKPSDFGEMSAEKRKFLEEVMKDGILDENERMKFILEKMTTAMEGFCARSGDIDVEELEDLLLELRDIVEQIDYARAFCSLQGIPFLLGCVQEREAVPFSIRCACLGILATICQNNPPVQLQLLEMGSVKVLSDIFFTEESNTIKAKVIQAISANVRNHETAEAVFCGTEQATEIIQQGLMADESLQKRTLFFLRALITADSADRARVRKFAPSVALVADNFLTNGSNNFEIRELSLELLNTLLQQKRSVNVILDRKSQLVGLGVQRVSAIRKLEGEEKDFAAIELEHWENLLFLLARAERDEVESVLMIEPGLVAPDALPQ